MQKAAKLWYLEQFNIFKVLSKREYDEIAEKAVHRHYKKGDPIMFPFNSQKKIYLLKDGIVKVGNYTENGEENLKYILPDGTVFGEMALSDGNANDFATAADDILICALDIGVLQDIMQRNKSFNIAMYKLIGLRLRKVESRLSAIVFKDSSTRIIDFIQELARDFGREKEGQLVVKNFLTHKDIAKLTFTSRQTVNSVFNRLKRDGQIDYDERYIRILDLQDTQQV
ncbi:MAG: Crp/Fnr family transcriptional regulator [Aureispira sp.]